MKKSFIWAAVLAMAVLAWIGSGQFGEADAPPEKMAEPAAKATVASVRVHTVNAEKRVQDLVMMGVTEASRMVTLRAETKGRVMAVPAREGEMLVRGTTVVRLVADDRQERLSEAKARLDQRQIQYDAARQLAKRSFRSKVQFSETLAELKAAQAALARIELDIRRTTIRAPFGGILESRSVEVGDFLDIGDPVASLVDLSPAFVIAEVTEREVGGISLGTPVRARLVTGRKVTGKISRISSVASEKTRTFKVEITLENADGTVAHGLTTEVRIPTREITAHRISPAILTLSDEGAVGVKTVNGLGQVEFHRIEVKQDTPEGVWVTGLPETARVITVGQEFVRTGDTVNAIDDGATTAATSSGSKS